MRGSSTKSIATNFSDSPGTEFAPPNAVSEAVSGVATDGATAGFEAVVSRSGGDEMSSKGVDSVFFRGDESKDIEAAEQAGGVGDRSSAMAGAVAEATIAAMEAAQTEVLPASPGHLAAAAIEKACDGDGEGGGGASGEKLGREGKGACEPSHADLSPPPSLSSDKVDKIRGDREEDGRAPEEIGVVEEERPVGQAAGTVAVADGIGPNESLRSTETVAGAAAGATTPVVAPRGRAAERLRPPPIVTEGSLPVPRTSSSERTGQADSGDDMTGDTDENGSNDPEQMRRCFVAKTFSPSDLGLGEMRHPPGDKGGGSAVQEALTKESLMKARKRRRTIHKGNIPGIEGRRHTVDEVLGLDDPQAVLGSVPPERLFSITGMFHPEAPVKVLLSRIVSAVDHIVFWYIMSTGVL